MIPACGIIRPMGSSFRLIAVDVDGTLLNTQHEVSPANRAALHRAHQAGITVCLCTGRSLTESRSVIETLGLDSDAGIFVFGAIVSSLPSGRTLYRTGIPEPTGNRLVRHFSEQGFPVLVLYDQAEMGLDYHLVRGERNLAAYEQWMELTPARLERVDEWHPGPCSPVRIGIIDRPEDIEETIASLRREFSPQEVKFNPIYAPNYRVHVVECFAPAVNKWYGITHVAGPLGISASQIAAIGDDVNDLEMIRQAGLGIAMGNAIEPVREAARRIVATNDQSGVAEAVDMILNGAI